MAVDLKKIPTTPGIYKFFYNSEIIYIGKAKNLKKRVSSYFGNAKKDRKTNQIKKLTDQVETFSTQNEVEALLLEQLLIKENKPKFNILLRDDKTYPYIFFSDNHEYPSIGLKRTKKAVDEKYFGPFVSSYAVKKSIKEIQKIFKLRNCSDNTFASRSRPCIEYQMKRCSAPCVGYISKNEYSLDVKNAINFLSGDSKRVVKNLSKKMDLYSEKKDYERAIIYRDKIQSIRDTQKKQNVLTDFNELDVFAVRKNKFSTCLSVLKVEAGWINSSQNFFPVTNDDTSEEELLSAFLESYVVKDKKRKEINMLFKGNISQDTKSFLNNLRLPKVNILVPSSKNENLIEICTSQAKDALRRNNNYSWIPDALEDLKKFLNLIEINKIEAFDISHTSGKEVSASCVVMNKSGPDKKNYRIMNIRKDSNDDYLALSEAIKRRCKNLQKNNLALPEVILIDGGKGQLNTVKKNLDIDTKNSITFISVSKGPNRKEKYDILHTDKKNFELKNLSKTKKLLQMLRNESHRFAINHHRKRRSKNLLRSNLDDIGGLGPKLKLNLIRYFGGVDKVMEASKDDLKAVPGIGVNKANQIFRYIKNQ